MLPMVDSKQVLQPEETQDTPTKLPTHVTIICKLVVRGSKVLRKGMQDSLIKLSLKSPSRHQSNTFVQPTNTTHNLKNLYLTNFD
jgi:hypothetical protein